MLIRFSTRIWDPESTRHLGIFVAAHELRDEGNLNPMDQNFLCETLSWFNETIPVPSLLKQDEHRRALSWFKSESQQAISRSWELANFMMLHDIEVELFKTRGPGIVIYEDFYQVVAKPAKGIRMPW